MKAGCEKHTALVVTSIRYRKSIYFTLGSSEIKKTKTKKLEIVLAAVHAPNLCQDAALAKGGLVHSLNAVD